MNLTVHAGTAGQEQGSPVEVWLRRSGNLALDCTVFFDDESSHELDVDSLSMRGAQREMTGYLLRQGYAPAGRWDVEARDPDGDVLESSRKFKLARS